MSSGEKNREVREPWRTTDNSCDVRETVIEIWIISDTSSNGEIHVLETISRGPSFCFLFSISSAVHWTLSRRHSRNLLKPAIISSFFFVFTLTTIPDFFSLYVATICKVPRIFDRVRLSSDCYQLRLITLVYLYIFDDVLMMDSLLKDLRRYEVEKR